MRRSIDQYRKDIQMRNSTIIGIQRNFESISNVLKNEKVENSTLKEQLNRFKKMYQQGNKRLTQYQEKMILVNSQLKRLRQENLIQQQQRKIRQKHLETTDNYKKMLNDYESNLLHVSNRLIQTQGEKKNLLIQLNKLKGFEGQRRKLNIKIVDLEEELKKMQDNNNVLNFQLKNIKDELNMQIQNNEQNKMKGIRLSRIEEQNRKKEQQSERIIQQLKNQINELQNNNLFLSQIQNLQKQVNDRDGIIEQQKRQIESLKNMNNYFNEQCQQIQDLRRKNNEVYNELEMARKEYDGKCQELQSVKERIENEKNQIKELDKYRNELIDAKIQISKIRDLINIPKQQNAISLEIDKYIKKMHQQIKQLKLDIERQKKNNKLLWNDNKKLKQKQKIWDKIQKQKLQSNQIKNLQRKKQSIILRINRDLKSNHQTQPYQSLSTLQPNQTLPLQNQYKKNITIQKLQDQVQFYKNRVKQMQALVSRYDKKIKQYQKNIKKQDIQKYIKQNIDLKQQNKKLNQKVQYLNKKINQQAKNNSEQINNLKHNNQSTYSTFQIQKKYANQRIQIIKKQLENLQSASIALHNHLSCLHCLQLPNPKTIKMVPCGHTYCSKCQYGYQIRCAQCNSSTNKFQDKHYDQTIIKIDHIQMILSSIIENKELLKTL